MISVCIATYNGERFIQRQLESILSQLSENDEVIVSDDGSKDATLQIIEELHSPMIHIYRNEGEHGYTPNFENALKHAKGDYIFLADQDDVWVSNKVEVCMKHFQKYDVVISDAFIIDEDNKEVAPSYFAERRSKSGFIYSLIRFSFLGCCIAFKRGLLDYALPFPSNHRKCTHDNWLTVIGMCFLKTLVSKEKLIYYRRHSNNISSGGFDNTTTLGFKFSYRLYIIKWLLIRFLYRR